MSFWFYPIAAAGSLLTIAANETEQPTEPEIIVVTANQQQQRWLDTSASVNIKTIPDNGILIDSAQLLQGIPGLQVDSRANFAQDTRLSIRGFGSRSAFGIRGLYLQQDGIPLSAPDGQGQLSSVLLDNIDRIEVLRGPMAVLYGNGAGGVISLQSRQQTPAAIKTALAFSQQHQQYQLQLSSQTAGHSWQLAAKHFETDGFRDNSAARKQQVQAGWQTELAKDLTLRLRLDFAYDPKLEDPLSLSIAQWQSDPSQTANQAFLFDTTKSTRQRQLSMVLTKQQPAPWQLGLWRGQREVQQRLAFTGAAITSAGGDIDLEREFQGINGQKQWQLTSKLNTLIGGAISKSDDIRRGFVNDFGERGELRRDELNLAQNRDVFWRFNYQATPAITLDGGLRYSELAYEIRDFFIQAGNPDDSGRKNYYQHSAALGINYRFSEYWAAFISTGKGFEAPTLAELAYKTSGSGLNLALNASQNRQWEAGLKFQQGSTQVALSLFSIQSNDELLVASSNNGRTSYRNAGDTLRQGIELHIQQQVLPYLQHELSITQLDARFNAAELEGKRLPGVAKTDLAWQWRYQFLPSKPWQLELTSVYRSRIAIDDNNSAFAPSAITFDTALVSWQQYQQWQLTYWLKLQNLTDRNNIGAVVVNQSNGRAFEPAPGRQFSAGLSLDYLW